MMCYYKNEPLARTVANRTQNIKYETDSRVGLSSPNMLPFFRVSQYMNTSQKSRSAALYTYSAEVPPNIDAPLCHY